MPKGFSNILFSNKQEKDLVVGDKYKTLLDVLNNSKQVKLEKNNGSNVAYYVVLANDAYNVICTMNGEKISQELFDNLEDIAKKFADTEFNITQTTPLNKEFNVFALTSEQRGLVKTMLLKERLNWKDSEVDEKEKQKLQRIIGRARNDIRNSNINWLAIETLGNFEFKNDEMVLNIKDNEEFADLVKSASRSYSDNEKIRYQNGINSYINSIDYNKERYSFDRVYLAKYNNEITIKSGKELIYEEECKSILPDKAVCVGKIGTLTNTNSSYIELNDYIENFEYFTPRLHSYSFDEAISNDVRRADKEEKELINTILKENPVYEQKLNEVSLEEQVEKLMKEEIKKDRSRNRDDGER